MVATERVIAQTDEVAVFLSCFWIYPTGFEFKVFVDTKDKESELDPFEFGRRHRGKDLDELSTERLLLGFQFADGTKATNVSKGSGWIEGTGSKPPLLVGKGASRGGGHSQHSYWLWPLPPLGPLEFVCSWPAAEIPLTRSELDSGAIVEAASRAQTIFVCDREAVD